MLDVNANSITSYQLLLKLSNWPQSCHNSPWIAVCVEQWWDDGKRLLFPLGSPFKSPHNVTVTRLRAPQHSKNISPAYREMLEWKRRTHNPIRLCTNAWICLFSQQGRNILSLPGFKLLPSSLHNETLLFSSAWTTTSVRSLRLCFTCTLPSMQHFPPSFPVVPFHPSSLLPLASPPPWETQRSVTVVVLPGSCGGDSGSSTQRLE